MAWPSAIDPIPRIVIHIPNKFVIGVFPLDNGVGAADQSRWVFLHCFGERQLGDVHAVITQEHGQCGDFAAIFQLRKLAYHRYMGDDIPAMGGEDLRRSVALSLPTHWEPLHRLNVPTA
jgi:hypothetical protein